jgi:hypothetical protein
VARGIIVRFLRVSGVLASAFAVGLFSLSSVAWAQGNSDEAEAMFRNLDTNKDGVL